MLKERFNTLLVLAVEMRESLQPGTVLLSRILDKCLAHTLQHLLSIQYHSCVVILLSSCSYSQTLNSAQTIDKTTGENNETSADTDQHFHFYSQGIYLIRLYFLF